MTTNPLLSESPGDWAALIESIGPASLLAVIEKRLGERLRDRYTPEDVLQEALLLAWRDREKFDWRGARAFRAWLLTVIDHRIADLADHENAKKRGGSHGIFREGDLRGSHAQLPDVLGSTTPSRIASHREQARTMRMSVEKLPEELRDVVWMRLFEQRQLAEIAELLGIGESAVRHRLRKGSELYQRILFRELASKSGAPEGTAAPERPNTAPDSG